MPLGGTTATANNANMSLSNNSVTTRCPRPESRSYLNDHSHYRTHSHPSSQPTSSSEHRTFRSLIEHENRMIPLTISRPGMVMRAGTATSLTGLSNVQLRAVLATERAMLKVEARAVDEYRAKVEREGNKQKRFKIRSIGKKQGGLEKRNG